MHIGAALGVAAAAVPLLAAPAAAAPPGSYHRPPQRQGIYVNLDEGSFRKTPFGAVAADVQYRLPGRHFGRSHLYVDVVQRTRRGFAHGVGTNDRTRLVADGRWHVVKVIVRTDRRGAELQPGFARARAQLDFATQHTTDTARVFIRGR